MAKKSIIARQSKREYLVNKYYSKRLEIKNKLLDKSLSFEDRFQELSKLSKLPRNSSKVRLRNRCKLTGRGRGVYPDLGLSRISFRELARAGMMPGMRKSSW